MVERRQGRMTGVPVRHTQFASWIDPDAWMESMEGPRWDKVLKEESELVVKVKSSPEVQSRLGPFRAAYDSVNSRGTDDIPFEVDGIEIQWYGQFFKGWCKKGGKEHVARDLVVRDNHVWCTEDVGDGAEDFQLQYWSNPNAGKPEWTKHPVGPDVALLEDRLYYLGVKNKLQYFQLWSCDATTGKNEKLLYTEKSPQANLSIERHADGRLLLAREISQEFHYYEIQENGRLKHAKSRWQVPSSWIMPLALSLGVDFCWPRAGYLITKYFGQRTLWHCGTNHSPKKLLQIPAGDILIDPWAVSRGDTECLVLVTQPDKGQAYYKLKDSTLELQSAVLPTGLQSRRFEGRSDDGTQVFGCLTYMDTTKPSKLLVIGYGAYGMSTAVGSVSHRWAALVQNGWCIAHTFIRGGGDHTEEWAKAGRRDGRKKTVADFKALVFAAQQEMKIPARATAIYGRSAGGLLVGEMLRQDPDGDLFQAIYTEVPYVDELRTTTNTDLPLTALEYNEFGAPSMRLEDFLHVGMTSPADSASVLSTPNTFVLTRTAAHDSQVFAYESVKWIRRLRENAPQGAPKLCIVEADQGHFTPPDLVVVQWSLDCAFLDAWVTKNSS